MLRTSKRKGPLQVMLMALVVLVIGITAPGYGDDDHDDGKNHRVENYLRLSGPAIEGTLTLVQTGADAFSAFSGTRCKGKGEAVNISFLFTQTVFGFTVTTTAKSLEGLLLQGVSASGLPTGCLRRGQTEDVVITLVVVDAEITSSSTTGFINANVKLLQVVPRLHKDRDDDKDKH